MKRYFYLLIAFAIWTFVMIVVAVGPETIGKGGIAKPGLAMEFASSTTDVENAFTLKPESCPRIPDGVLKYQVIRQQYLDFVFIGLYWAVFFFVIGRSLMLSPGGVAWIFGLLVCICITLAAIADVLEDVAILHVICGGHRFWPLWFGAPKWMFYFLAMGFSAALFFLRPATVFATPPTARFSGLVTVSVIVSGVLLTAGSLAGLTSLAMLLLSCRYGEIIGPSSSLTGLPVIVLMIQCFRNSRSEPAMLR